MGRALHVGLALVGMTLHWRIAGAWSPTGHDRIARIAEHFLVGKHKDQIRTMMHSDLPDIEKYEEIMTQKYPATDALHWHRQDPEWTCGSKGGLGDRGHIRCDGHGAAHGSLFCALAYFFEHFAHDALLKEYPQPKEPIGTPEHLYALKKVPAKDQNSATFLKWLVILVGDMHQPLHWLHEHDYGRGVKIRYKDEEHTLLSFWETYLPSHLTTKLETGVQPSILDKDFDQHAKSWSHKVPTELFRDWGKEIAQRVCSEVYAPMTVNHADGTRVESPFTLPDDLFDKWAKLAEELIQLSGERLGFILNDIIEHKRHKDAVKDGRSLPSKKKAVGLERSLLGETMAKFAAETARKTPGAKISGAQIDFIQRYKSLKIEHHRRSSYAGLYNLGIAAFLVPGLLFAFSWHERIGGGDLLRLAKIKM